jgi:hypothetical protein
VVSWKFIELRIASLLLSVLTLTPLEAAAQSIITSEPTHVILTASHGASGDVTLTAAVMTAQGAGVAGGTIQFIDEATMAVLGWAEVSRPSISIARLAAGHHRLRADYSGSSDYLPTIFQPAQSGILVENVLAVPEVALSSSSNPSSPGQLVTLTAVVIGRDAMPTGTVTFREGRRVIAAVGLDRMGAASFTTSALSDGSRAITADYQGDDANAPAISRRLAQDVGSMRVLSSQLVPPQ